MPKVGTMNRPTFMSLPQFDSEVKSLVTNSTLSDEAVVKLTAQLEYHAKKDPGSLKMRTEQIVKNYTHPSGFKFPTKRYGKTELQMPIVTTGQVSESIVESFVSKLLFAM